MQEKKKTLLPLEKDLEEKIEKVMNSEPVLNILASKRIHYNNLCTNKAEECSHGENHLPL